MKDGTAERSAGAVSLAASPTRTSPRLFPHIKSEARPTVLCVRLKFLQQLVRRTSIGDSLRSASHIPVSLLALGLLPHLLVNDGVLTSIHGAEIDRTLLLLSLHYNAFIIILEI